MLLTFNLQSMYNDTCHGYKKIILDFTIYNHFRINLAFKRIIVSQQMTPQSHPLTCLVFMTRMPLASSYHYVGTVHPTLSSR